MKSIEQRRARAATSSNHYGIRDRIDYIYYQGEELEPVFSTVSQVNSSQSRGSFMP